MVCGGRMHLKLSNCQIVYSVLATIVTKVSAEGMRQRGGKLPRLISLHHKPMISKNSLDQIIERQGVAQQTYLAVVAK